MTNKETNYTAVTFNKSHKKTKAKLVLTFVDREVSRSQRRGIPYGRNLGFLDLELLFFLPCNSIVLTKLSGPRSRLTASQKIW
jgi:hypothetical protein